MAVKARDERQSREDFTDAIGRRYCERMNEQRRNQERPRVPFSAIARMAIEHSVPETRVPQADWHERINDAWVRWPSEGGFAYLRLHRHLDWITGEFGIAHAAVAIDALTLLPDAAAPESQGAMIRLGDLVEEADRWWRAGADQKALAERLEWMALELRVKGSAYFHRRDSERERVAREKSVSRR